MILAKLAGIPKWAYAVAAAFVLIIAVQGYISSREKAAVEADRAVAGQKATETARKADEAARSASQGKSEEVEKENRDAEDASRDSSDPLADALRSLRNNASR